SQPPSTPPPPSSWPSPPSGPGAQGPGAGERRPGHSSSASSTGGCTWTCSGWPSTISPEHVRSAHTAPRIPAHGALDGRTVASMREMDVLGVRVSIPENEVVVVLAAKGGGRTVLPIVIGPREGASIATAQAGIVPERPQTHDLFISLL